MGLNFPGINAYLAKGEVEVKDSDDFVANQEGFEYGEPLFLIKFKDNIKVKMVTDQIIRFNIAPYKYKILQHINDEFARSVTFNAKVDFLCFSFFVITLQPRTIKCISLECPRF